MSTPSCDRPPERACPHESPNEQGPCTGNDSSGITGAGAAGVVGAGVVGVVAGGAVTGGAVTGGAVTGGAVTGGAVTGGAVTGGAGVAAVRSRPSATAVASSRTPVAGRPACVWNVRTAVVVAPPKNPSAPPRTATPTAISRRWR